MANDGHCHDQVPSLDFPNALAAQNLFIRTPNVSSLQSAFPLYSAP